MALTGAAPPAGAPGGDVTSPPALGDGVSAPWAPSPASTTGSSWSPAGGVVDVVGWRAGGRRSGLLGQIRRLAARLEVAARHAIGRLRDGGAAFVLLIWLGGEANGRGRAGGGGEHAGGNQRAGAS